MARSQVIYIVLLLSSHLLFSQGKYLPASIVTAEGVLTTGYIKYSDWDRNPQVISFRTGKNSSVSELGPDQVREFRVNKEIYRSGVVQAETSPRKVDLLSFEDQMSFTTEAAFVKVIVEGEKSLYMYRDQSGRSNFYTGEPGHYTLLRYKRYLTESEGKTVISEYVSWLSQLDAYLVECPGLKTNRKEVDYNYESLRRHFQIYYTCTGKKPEYILRSDEKTRLEVLIMGGINRTQFGFSDKSFAPYNETTFEAPVRVTAGVGLDLKIAGTRDRFVISNIFTYQKLKTTGKDYDREEVYAGDNDFYFNYDYLKLSNIFRYGFSYGNVLVQPSVGIAHFLNIKETDLRYRHSWPGTVVISDAFDNSNKYELGVNFGLRLKFNRYSLDAMYELGTGMSNNYLANTYANSLIVLLGVSIIQ